MHCLFGFEHSNIWQKGKEEDNNLKRMKSIGKEVVTAEYKNIESSFYDRNIKPLVKNFQTLTLRAISKQNLLVKDRKPKTCAPAS